MNAKWKRMLEKLKILIPTSHKPPMDLKPGIKCSEKRFEESEK